MRRSDMLRGLGTLTLHICVVLTVCGNSFYLDPVNGDNANDGSLASPWSSFEAVIAAGYISSMQYSPLPYDPLTSGTVTKNLSGPVQAGDTLILLSGLHGKVFLQNYINTTPITVIAGDGQVPIIESIWLQACRNWRFEHLYISSEPYGNYIHGKLFFIETHGWQGPSAQIVVDHCEIYSTASPWMQADDWVTKASDGLFIRCDTVVAAYNTIRNIDMGLTAYGNNIYAHHNEVINFSGDGMRLLGSHNTFESNLIKNCYDVDDNHDDGIQSWTTNGIVVDDNLVIGNTIINTDDPDRPLNGPLQGIGCFDGFYNNWTVVNNVICVNHWHGITFLGARNCKIINNTVLDPSPDVTPGASWIRIDDHKDGTASENCLVANNVCNTFIVDGMVSNNMALNTYSEYAEHFVDYLNFDFHLNPSSGLIDAGNAAYAPEKDIEGNSRTMHGLPDIGAYEYVQSPSATNNTSADDVPMVWPNPFHESISLKNVSPGARYELIAAHGECVRTGIVDGVLHLHDLSPGMYFLRIAAPHKTPSMTKLLKL